MILLLFLKPVFLFLATIGKRKRKVIRKNIMSAQCPLLQYTLLEQFAASWPKEGKNVLKACQMTRMTVSPWWGISTKTSSVTMSYMMDPSDHGKVLQLSTIIANMHGTKESTRRFFISDVGFKRFFAHILWNSALIHNVYSFCRNLCVYRLMQASKKALRLRIVF